MSLHDIVFIGHLARDRVSHYGQDPVWMTGGSIMYGSIAAARIGARVAALAKMSEADLELADEMKQAGVETHLVAAAATTIIEVIYPDDNVEHRRIFMRGYAGGFSRPELPDVRGKTIHLAGNAGCEFPPDFIHEMRKDADCLSLDIQGFVRQRDPDTDRVELKDVPGKQDIIGCLDILKLDVVEAQILTGESDLVRASRMIADWGCPEIVTTTTDGVVGFAGGKAVFEPFSNKNLAGRNGRGDTTFAGYLTRRLTHGPAEALKFAAALVSIKLEKRGPFDGTLTDVLERMSTSH